MQEEFTIGRLLGVLYKRKGIVLSLTCAAAILAIVVSFLLTPLYMSVASLLPRDEDSGSGLSSLFSQSGMGIPFGLLGAGAGGTGRIDKEIIHSITLRSSIVESLDLYEFYDLSEMREEEPRGAWEQAITLLGENTMVEFDELTQVLRVSVTSKEAVMSRDILVLYLHELDDFNIRKQQESGAAKRVFLEKRLAATGGEQAEVEAAIRDFSAEHGVVHLPSELEAELTLVAELSRRLVFKELERSALAQDAAPASPVLERINNQIQVLRDQLKMLQEDGDPAMRLHALNDLPSLSLSYYQLQRNLRIQQEISNILVQQIEQARLQEANNVSTLKILDVPGVATIPVWPRKKLIVIAATLLGFLLACFVALLREFLGRVRRNDNDAMDAWQWLPLGGKKSGNNPMRN